MTTPNAATASNERAAPMTKLRAGGRFLFKGPRRRQRADARRADTRVRACLVSMLRELRPVEIVVDAMFESDKP